LERPVHAAAGKSLSEAIGRKILITISKRMRNKEKY